MLRTTDRQDKIAHTALTDFLWCAHYATVEIVFDAVEKLGYESRTITVGQRVFSLPKDRDEIGMLPGWNRRAEACSLGDIAFWGGPTHKQWYKDMTLQDFMDDMIMRSVLKQGLATVRRALSMEYLA